MNKYKTSEHTNLNKNKHIDKRTNQQFPERKGSGEGEMVKGDQLYGTVWKLKFLVVSMLSGIQKQKYNIIHMKLI